VILDQDIIDKLQAALDRGDDDAVRDLTALVEDLEAEEDERLRRAGALRSAALWYASQGIAVFPLLPRDKRPLFGRAHRKGEPGYDTCHGECGRDGHGLYDATLDPVRIDRWWQQRPDANVGAPTGHHFDVIDIDPPHGYMSLAKLRDEGKIPPTIGRALTGRRGIHLFIRPTGDGNGAKVRPGVDYRGLGGYVALPPSISATGNRYAWTEPLGPLPLRPVCLRAANGRA
jgi:hypothetical protein